MTDLTEIDGVGPARAEDLEDEGYDSAEDVADADPDELDELFTSTSGEDLVSSAQDETVLGDDVEDAAEESDEDESEDTEEVEAEDDEDPAKTETFTLEPGFDDTQEYHLMAALVNEEVKARRTNNAGRLEATQDALAQVRAGEPYEFTMAQLSIAYTGTNQLESEYRGTRGLAQFVGGVREIRNVFQNARQQNWPAEE
jgi:hypothetical protein